MKKQHYLPFLSLLFLLSCGSDDDTSAQSGSEPDPDLENPIAESPYEIPPSLEDYYKEVDFSLEGEELLEEVATLIISTHSTFLDYGQRHDYLYEADEDPDNPNNVLLVYSGDSRDKREYVSGNNPHETQTFNTEHIFPQSLIGNTAKGDLHHLKPADEKDNSSRSNYPYTDAEGAYEVVGGNSFYPGEEWRGDVARMIMYMNLRYDEPFDEVGNLELFLEWNSEDPVSAIEKNRNDVIQGAQGNRNPFIDNPHLATRIWGGAEAQNRWDGKEEPEEKDEQAPSIPQNIVAEASFESVNLSWEASTDNDRVVRYEVFVDSESYKEINALTLIVSELIPGTGYSFTVRAIDASGNRSEVSEALEAFTMEDTEAPSVPAGIFASATSANSIQLSWDPSTDNAGILGYDVHLNGELHSTVATNKATITQLEAARTYTFSIRARDIYGNESQFSVPLEATTAEEGDSDGDGDEESPGGIPDLFFSEYIEGGSNNKALEIVNLTGVEIDLSHYSIKKIINERAVWVDELPLTGTLPPGEVFVAAHSSAGLEIKGQADILKGSGPLNFNGNDPVGLFKDGELIDMIGILGGTDFAKDITLRRKSTVTGPSRTYDVEEWEVFEKDTFNGIGSY